MEKRRNRSDKYQYISLETVCSHDMMENFSTEYSIYKRLNPFSYDEKVLELEDELKKEFWNIVDDLLTKRQKQVLQLCAQGKTQLEIARELNVNQSSITKSIHGNVDYKNGKKAYGGSAKKIKKIIHKHKRIKEILEKIHELREDTW